MCESQEPPSPFKSTFTHIILSLLTGAYNSQRLYHNMTEHLWDRKFKYNYISFPIFAYRSQKRYIFSKLPLILNYIRCIFVSDPIIFTSSRMNTQLSTLFLYQKDRSNPYFYLAMLCHNAFVSLFIPLKITPVDTLSFNNTEIDYYSLIFWENVN